MVTRWFRFALYQTVWIGLDPPIVAGMESDELNLTRQILEVVAPRLLEVP